MAGLTGTDEGDFVMPSADRRSITRRALVATAANVATVAPLLGLAAAPPSFDAGRWIAQFQAAGGDFIHWNGCVWVRAPIPHSARMAALMDTARGHQAAISERATRLGLVNGAPRIGCGFVADRIA